VTIERLLKDGDGVYGRGQRNRPKVTYDDGLTDTQWTRMIEEGKSVQDVQRPRRRGKEDEMMDEDDDEEITIVRKRGRPRGSKNKGFNSRDIVENVDGRGRRKKQKTMSIDPEIERRRARFDTLYKAIKNFKDTEGRIVCSLFVKLPSRKAYPDYYEVIKKPIDMNKINERIQSNYYQNSEQFELDCKLLFSNAQEYNIPGSQIYEDSVLLTKLFQTEFGKLKEKEQEDAKKRAANMDDETLLDAGDSNDGFGSVKSSSFDEEEEQSGSDDNDEIEEDIDLDEEEQETRELMESYGIIDDEDEINLEEDAFDDDKRKFHKQVSSQNLKQKKIMSKKTPISSRKRKGIQESDTPGPSVKRPKTVLYDDDEDEDNQIDESE